MSDAESSRGGSAVPTASRVREQVRVRRRRRARQEIPGALDADRWVGGARSRRLRMFTLGSSVLVALAIVVYFIFRQ